MKLFRRKLGLTRSEFLWYYGQYLLGSSARRGSSPPGLQGVWPMDSVMPPWRGDCHGDMNVQETFWPACASGHLDLLDSWCDLMKQSIEPAQRFTRRFFGTEGTFWVCAMLPHYTIVPGWHTVQYAWSSSGWLGSLAWMRWRDTLRIFPAMPDHWRRAAFCHLVAEGAFRVSAVRRDGHTTWVRIVAGVDRPLRLRNPFEQDTFEVTGGVLRRQGKDLLADLSKGQEIVLRLPGEPLRFENASRGVRQSDISRIGLR